MPVLFQSRSYHGKFDIFLYYCGIIILIQITHAWHALIDLEEYRNLVLAGATFDDSTTNTTLQVNITQPTQDLLELKGTRFFILRKKITWPEALTKCQAASLRLVSLPLREDAISLATEIQKISQPYFEGYDDYKKTFEFGMDRRYWIGLTDMVVEGDWEWISEGYSLRYEDMWYPEQPDHLRRSPPSSEHCVSLWNPGYAYGDTHTFNDEDCAKKYYAICGKQPPFLKVLLRDRGINQAYPTDKLEALMKDASTTPPTTTAESSCSGESEDGSDGCSEETTTTAKPKHRHAKKKKSKAPSRGK